MNWLVFFFVSVISGVIIIKCLSIEWNTYIPFRVNYQINSNSKSSATQEILKRAPTYEAYSEISCVKNCDPFDDYKTMRPGLVTLKDLHRYLPTMKVKFSKPSPELKPLIKMWKKYLLSHCPYKNAWRFAKKLFYESLIKDKYKRFRKISCITAAMKSSKVKWSDLGYKGTQLKLSLMLEGRKRAIFKPKRSKIHEVFEGSIYAGVDRHQGEIVAFHLSLLLNMTKVPPVIGRKFSLRRDILPVASRHLSKTVFYQGKRVCFYGTCYYCSKDNPVCDNGYFIDGALILWIPDFIHLAHYSHPWSRTYKDRLARWEVNKNFCYEISPSLFTKERFPLLLSLIDVSIFDFLIQNGDRHHFTVSSKNPFSSIIMLDNGKSFGDPLIDHLDVLAPLIQCCRIRRSTYERLLLFTGGGLSKSLDDLLSTDVLYPVISILHLKAMDRRLYFVLAAVEACRHIVGDKVLFS